ncbi:hypothetical protein [Rhizobium hidalgonense]|uniref:hypothetical protein n=1 Tax=Rhizobium hidalgonense TaxID=1538159 RepID=UPI002870C0A6|nr:hypothetical protein [Rhizobium hidalgonense]MDR9804676.1 hypothetical protein [Rhizobium hidalgonense]
MTCERHRQRNAEVLEFLSSAPWMGGEFQAALESFLIQSQSARPDDSVPTFTGTSQQEHSINER